jgi:lipooligosaccharide transport system permease protein
VWHGTQLSRQVTYGAVEPVWLTLVHVVVLVGMTAAGLLWARRSYTRRMGK